VADPPAVVPEPAIEVAEEEGCHQEAEERHGLTPSRQRACQILSRRRRPEKVGGGAADRMTERAPRGPGCSRAAAPEARTAAKRFGMSSDVFSDGGRPDRIVGPLEAIDSLCGRTPRSDCAGPRTDGSGLPLSASDERDRTGAPSPADDRE